MDVQIPLYRAKRLDSDEYVEGYYFKHKLDGISWILLEENIDEDEFKIDPSTLAIHFPGMIDSEGNKIFASLSESGKGGDVVECWTKEGANLMDAIMIYKNYNIGITYAWGFHRYNSFKMIDEIENKAVKIIGIQK